MNQQAHRPAAPSRRSAGAARLAASRSGRGSGAPSPRLTGLLALAITAVLAFTATPASAAIVHPYQSQITEAGGSPLGGPLSLFGSLRGLAVDSTGNLYVTDAANQAIDKFDSTGAPVTAWGTNGQLTEANGSAFASGGDESGLFGLAVDGSDNLWASDLGGGLIDKFDSAGAFLAEGNGEGHWSGAYTESIAYSDAAERLFVIDSGTGELWALKPDATVESGLANFGTCCFFKTAADNSGGATGGDLYVSGEGNAVFRIHGSGAEAGEPAPFSATAPYVEGSKLTGGPSGPFGTQGTGLGVKGLAVDSAGDLFVAGENGVFEFGPSGKALGRITGTPTGPGGSQVPFGEVTAVGIGAASGKLYVADSANHVVDVFGAGVLLPDVATEPATAITTTSATFNGEVNPEGLAVEECFFEWGTTTAYGEIAPCQAPDAAEIGSGTSPVAVHADVSLPSGATIHFRLVAKNANGTNTEGGDQSFFTGASIDSTSVSEVSATAATLETELNPHGLPTTYHFEYDTVEYHEGEPPHGAATPTGSAGSGSADVFRSAQIQGLQPLTTYHYRAVAENAFGTSEGEDRAFTTQGPGSALLPDARAWEMVTPANKHGAPLKPLSEGGGLDQAAADGSAFATVAAGPLGPESQGSRSPDNSQFLSARGPAGWSTADITTPHEEISQMAVRHPEYKFFADDLSRALVEPTGADPLSPADHRTHPLPPRRERHLRAAPHPCKRPARHPIRRRRSVPRTSASHGVEFRTASPMPPMSSSPRPRSSPQRASSRASKSTRRLEGNLYELSGGSLTLLSVLPSAEAAVEAGLRSGGRRGNASTCPQRDLHRRLPRLGP